MHGNAFFFINICMKLVETKPLRWVVYDSNGKVVLITSNKSIAVSEFKKLSFDSAA